MRTHSRNRLRQQYRKRKEEGTQPGHPIMQGVAADYVVVTKDDLDPLPNYTWAVVPAKNALAVEPDNPDRRGLRL